ncbi:Polymerase epsilon subunit (plasmid) [Sinorhizobium sp. CCBAU 05631]|nr:Polymerase epsilon subunit [Sinorhizobium sp. CCBAU 05631]
MRQPSISIPGEITKLTGITDEMVAGQLIDMRALGTLIDPADLVIAHNAGLTARFAMLFR